VLLQTISMAYNMARLQEATGAADRPASDVGQCQMASRLCMLGLRWGFVLLGLW
jgi:hypothetical protein